VSWSSLPARYLDRGELEALVTELAGQPERWQAHIGFAATGRHYVSLYRDDNVDIWLLCWKNEDDTGWHDHDISSGAVRVLEGALRESNPRIGGDPFSRTIPGGTLFSFGPEHIHRLAAARDRSISLHAYSPPLWRLGQYSISEDGVMRRLSVSYADELRPLDERRFAA